MSALRVETLTGPAIAPHLLALARLRMEVFRAWPYLYDGNDASESEYLAEFTQACSAGLVIAFDGAAPVGCSTCLALAEASADIQAPFITRGLAIERVFYFGESVLLAGYRHRGIGVEFFRAREIHARQVSAADYAAFCAVNRPPDHPLHPPDIVPLDDFWRHRGFSPYPDMICRMHWKQVDIADEVENRLSFWLKSLTGAPLP